MSTTICAIKKIVQAPPIIIYYWLASMEGLALVEFSILCSNNLT
jgi:hypothetical protein